MSLLRFRAILSGLQGSNHKKSGDLSVAALTKKDGLREIPFLDNARNQKIKHGDHAGDSGSEDEAFEAGFVDFGLTVHGCVR